MPIDDEYQAYETLFNILVMNKKNRANALQLDGVTPFQIGIYQHHFGFYVGCCFMDGKKAKGFNDRILGREACIEWLRNCEASLA